jgi:hypothetical protein
VAIVLAQRPPFPRLVTLPQTKTNSVNFPVRLPAKSKSLCNNKKARQGLLLLVDGRK